MFGFVSMLLVACRVNEDENADGGRAYEGWNGELVRPRKRKSLMLRLAWGI